MESRIHSVLFQFNHGIEQALAALDTLKKIDLEPPGHVQQIRVRFQEVAANVNSHFTDRVSKQEIPKQPECERERRQHEEEANPDCIYLRVAAAEDIRRQRGLPPRAVILPWTRLDDDRALARVKSLGILAAIYSAHNGQLNAISSERGRKRPGMTNTAYEILAMLDRHFEESVTLLKQLTTCPGQRSDILIPLSNELRYVRAQIGYEVTEQASDFEMERADHWGRIHRRFEEWLKDPDDIYLHVEEREEERKKKSLAPRVIILPWSYEEEQKVLGRNGREQGRNANSSPRPLRRSRPRKEPKRHENRSVSRDARA
jgi:hypothetical protein